MYFVRSVNSMKRSSVIVLAVVLVILLFPFRIKRYPIEGTVDIGSLLCRLVVWNRDFSSDGKVYHRTALYFFPDTLKDIEDLYDMEMERPDMEEHVK